MTNDMVTVSSPFTDTVVFIHSDGTEEVKNKNGEASKDNSNVNLKKDGTPKRVVNNKHSGEKSEVYPFRIEDIKKIVNYFSGHQMWQCYLIFILSLNMARRISDTLSLKWNNFYDPANGRMRADLEIREKKTDKLANPRINTACKKAIEMYIEKTNTDPSENSYDNYVFMQTSGNYKGRVLTDDGYRKALKRAANEIGIDYNVGTHSPRKTFGMISRMLHPGDYNSMELLQTIYNHSDTKVTKHYIGLTKKEVDAYYDDIGAFTDDYITGNKTYEEISEKPIVSLDANDLRDIITAAYKAGKENANETDGVIHIEAINTIMQMIDDLSK